MPHRGQTVIASRFNGWETGIPHKILFAPDGTILSRRIASSRELDRKLEEIFNKLYSCPPF